MSEGRLLGLINSTKIILDYCCCLWFTTGAEYLLFSYSDIVRFLKNFHKKVIKLNKCDVSLSGIEWSLKKQV